MYSVKTNIRQLVSLMLRHDVRDVVVSPGSRNMPLAETFAHVAEISCYPVTDERSAGFIALGISQRKNVPVAVCVTSGSALLNLASSVSEAYYQQIPLLVISADRPLAWIGQMDGQTLPQTGVFGSLVKYEANLCEPNNDTERWFNNRLINEALLALTYRWKGPVHVNVPISEPFFDCGCMELPDERVIGRKDILHHAKELNNLWCASHSPLVIVGQMVSPDYAERLSDVLERLHCPVLCESLSNVHGSAVFHDFDLTLISADNQRDLAPDMVVYLGGHLVSKRLKQWLRGVRPAICWRVSEEDSVADTFQCLTDVVDADPISLLDSLAQCSSQGRDAYLRKWREAERTTVSKKAPSLPFSSIETVRRFCDVLPTDSTLVLANSSAVRYAQLSAPRKDVTVFCNRGVNGIDGSLSAAVGVAMADLSREVFLLIGDLSFFYDMNALWNTALPSNIHILLLNNGGGEIFRNLPGLKESEGTRKFVMAEHRASACEWVKSVGCDYLSAHDFSEFESGLSSFLEKKNSPSFMEVFTDAREDESAHREFYNRFK